MKKALLFAVSLICAVPLLAQSVPQIPGTKDISRVTAGTYQADPGHTLIGWNVNHFGFTDYFGIFGDVSGTLVLDPEAPGAAKIDIIIPVSKVTTASTGLTGHLLRAGKDGGIPDFFGPSPSDARYVSTQVIPRESGIEATVIGDLTLNGVTKPVTLEVIFSGAGTNPFSKKATVGFKGQADIKRSDFGIAYGIPMVSDEVSLTIEAAFEK